ncbi:Gar1-domain-containing protein [Cucurbitaria berberidis CBS 394.84]|uniref:H/ACA ribonucleoprotein complex subunit n=1 Tax=Cucurbitaria berberidis CBS 394.84 TaxID=1168544 RepID=A0A9P4L673_9PLEO|nr:Gar1-domain-containing protein [Cucurbitaria berberidis CBS 394.84]KAF1843666.1 Gar1-domain-containing protein [Cucurbitaria berberidis CBS 394.84]
MAFRGTPRGGRGGGFGGGRGGFTPRGGRGGAGASYGPPDQVFEMGKFVHDVENEMFCESINVKIPYFNAPVYLENKTPIGKVDEILGPLNQVFFTIKPQEGIQAKSFKAGDKFYIGGDKLLPIDRFLPKPKPVGGTARVKKPAGAGGRGAPRGGSRGFGGRGRGAPRGRGGPPGRGGSRGSFGGGGFSRGGGGGGFSRGGRGGGGGFGGRGRGGY